jgi:hypothetical protein
MRHVSLCAVECRNLAVSKNLSTIYADSAPLNTKLCPSVWILADTNERWEQDVQSAGQVLDDSSCCSLVVQGLEEKGDAHLEIYQYYLDIAC